LAVLPAVETAAIVINAESGAELVTQRMMTSAAERRLCRLIIVNKIDADGVVELDDALMDRYLERGEEIAIGELHEPFERALRAGHLIPVCFVSAKTG